MQKIFKRMLSFCLAIAVCLSTAAVLGVTHYQVADAAAGNYYDGITATGGTALLGQLHDLIVTTHKTYTSYDDCKKYGPTTDPALDGGSGVMEFYTHETIKNFVGGLGDWNREHVWCQSLSGGLWGTGGGGSDLHHIRPSESGLNSIRGNNKYGYVNGGKEAWSRDNSKNNSKLGGYVGGGAFEPLDNVKGDVARIVMYVYTHYNNASNVGGTKEAGKTHGNLPFTNVINESSHAAAVKLLLDWNKLDPVDEIELYRNEAVYKIQGNRNPFIDNESYAEAIWGGGSVVDPPVNPNPTPNPSVLTGLKLNATALNLTVGEDYHLSVTPVPASESASVTWTSSNSSVATVSDGIVTAITAGTATITATSTVNSSIKATATVTVRKVSSPSTATDSIEITRDSFVNPSGGYGVQDWKVGDIEGTAFMYGGKKDSIQFNTSKASQYIASDMPTDGAIKKVTVECTGNKTWSLYTSTMPYDFMSSGNPTNGTKHTPDSTNGTVWTVDGSDTYFSLVLGGDGVSYISKITIEFGSDDGSSEKPDELKELIINPAGIVLEEGESTELAVSSIPSTVSAQVIWTSSNPAVATVDEDGTVTAIKAGTATITATSTVNSSIKATAAVTVTEESFVSDKPAVTAFHNAVVAINSNGTLAAWRTSINTAITAYKNLSADDKTEVAADIETLNSAIASYNEKIKAYNGADEHALKGAGVFI